MVARFHYDDAIYERLLADKLPPSERTDVTRHVETCQLCQAKLETLAEAGIDWQDVRRYLDRSGLVGLGSVEGEGDTKNVGVEFLTPSEMPHSLGRFGRYEIMEILGRGGMGIVMRGYDPALDRHSAIKVLAPELAASAAARGRFSREAKSAAAVVHEHVVPIQTVDQENGLPYLVMPVLEGKSLEQRVRQQGILTVTETLRIGRQIALGLAAAHAQGLVHRDVKPANILLHNGVERVVITDFGLARAIDDASLTQSGTIVGTPQYMSPEQAKGEHVDARGDLFSLGSVLYFMLAGHSPFRAETTMGVLHRIVNDTPRPLRQINPEVPPWLEQIISRLLAKDPADRYASAAEVAELLGQWLAHLQDPTSEPRPSQPPEEPRTAIGSGRARFTKIALGLLGGAAVLLAGIFVVLETGKGTITIESDRDDISVRITQGETVERRLKVTPGENVVRLAAGRYLVEIEGEHDGLTVENDRVTLARGDVEVVRIVREVVEQRRPEVGHSADRAAEDDSPPDSAELKPLQGTWTATSEISDGPWRLEDDLSSIWLGIHDELFELKHVDAQQEIRHQAWGKLVPIKSDLDGIGELEVNFPQGYPGSSLRFSYRLEGDDLTIEVLASDPPEWFGKEEKKSWSFHRGIKVPNLLKEGEIGYGRRSVESENFVAVGPQEENVFAVYSKRHKTWDRHRFPEGLKIQEVVDDLLRFEEFGEMKRDSYMGFNLSGKPVDELVAVDIKGRFQTYSLDTPIDEELVVFMFGDGLLYYAANEHVYAFSGITGTWDALPVPGLPSVTMGDGRIETPINNYGGRPGIVVTLPEEVAIFAPKSGKWERISHDQAKRDPRFEDFNHDLKLFEPGYNPAGGRVDEHAPETKGAASTRSLDAAVPAVKQRHRLFLQGLLGGLDLAEAVQAFNQQHANHPIGKDQPPLTADEVIASIVWAGRQGAERDAMDEVPDLLTREILDRRLPPGWRFEIEMEFPGVDGERFQGWEIALVSDEAEGESGSHRVRRRLLAQVDEEGRPLPLPELGEAEPDATPLAAAIAAFNRQRQSLKGRPQPPLTEEEVVAAILHWKTRRDETPVTNRDFEAIQKVAQTRQLPAGMQLELLPEFVREDGSRQWVWSVRIRTPQTAKEGWTFAYEIRKQYVLWEAAAGGEIKWGPVAENGMQAGVRLQPGQDEYSLGTQVRPKFFFRSTSDRREGVTFPRIMPRAYYDRIMVGDDQGKAILVEHHRELDGPVGWIEMPFNFGAQHEISGLPMVLGDAERGEAETVIRARVGQTVHIRFVLPNYADRTAPPLETGEVMFTLSAPGATLPKLLIR